jgi:hypothetical protein
MVCGASWRTSSTAIAPCQDAFRHLQKGFSRAETERLAPPIVCEWDRRGEGGTSTHVCAAKPDCVVGLIGSGSIQRHQMLSGARSRGSGRRHGKQQVGPRVSPAHVGIQESYIELRIAIKPRESPAAEHLPIELSSIYPEGRKPFDANVKGPSTVGWLPVLDEFRNSCFSP